MRNKLRIFTWHIHGSYLYYLSQGHYDVYIPVNAQKTEGYYGRGETFPFGSNVTEVPAAAVRDMEFDVILFQTHHNYLIDQYEILSPAQRQLPRVFLQHDPPLLHPVDQLHPVNDPEVMLVHVTHFNKLMYNSQRTPVRVIEHGVTVHNVTYDGTVAKGIVVINNLPSRGRRLGLDVFEAVQRQVPIDLIGMGNGRFGSAEVLHPQLPAFVSRYRFFFNPIRYTSLGLAVAEAMQIGVPVVGLATTEMVTLIQNGVNGYLHTDIDYLIEKMNLLLQDPAHAAALGAAGKQTAMERFDIQRFTKEWEALFTQMAATHQPARAMIQA